VVAGTVVAGTVVAGTVVAGTVVAGTVVVVEKGVMGVMVGVVVHQEVYLDISTNHK